LKPRRCKSVWVAVVVAIVLLISSPSGAEDYKTIFPSDEAHNLLPKTCKVCHKTENFNFFIVVSQGKEGLDNALNALSAGGGPGSLIPQKPLNPHFAVACLFCHMEQPSEGMSSMQMSFRTLEGEGVPVFEDKKLCDMCHPANGWAHPQILAEGDAVKETAAEVLQKVGMNAPDGQIVCSTCHDMHNEEVGLFDLYSGYDLFASKSPLSMPHGNRAACKGCHENMPTSEADAALTNQNRTELCTRCHAEDHGRIHPVGVKSSEKTYPMDFLQYPLDEEGRADCSTCHDELCGEKQDKRNRAFLRGGPYMNPTDFCFRCHPRSGEFSLNPHNQVNEKGEVVKTTCSFCHRVTPEKADGSDFRPQDLLFIKSPVELCMWCHNPKPHPDVNHLVNMSDKKISKLRDYEERHRVKMPLDRENNVVCITCHNPHEKGVVKNAAALGASEVNQWRVPSFAELCTPCHARYD